MKKKLLPVIALLSFLCVNYVRAQDAPIHIAIIPFTSSNNVYNERSITEQVQNEVASCFANKDRFFLLDRGTTDKLKTELDAAKDNASVYAKVVANQGHLAGAEYIITGVVDPLEIGETTTTNTYTKITSVAYHGSIRLSLNIIKVETGRVFYNEPLTITSKDFNNKSNSDIQDNAMCWLKSKVQELVRTLFSAPMIILSVEKEKKGLPEKVLVNAGAEILDNGKRSSCDGLTLGSLFQSKKLALEVYSEESITAGGKTYKRVKVIGALKVASIEGELAVCDVSTGAEAIKTLLDSKQSPLVRIAK